MISSFRPDGSGPLYFGLYPAIVTDIVDPDNLGRIQVKFPSLGEDGDTVRSWATLITPFADDNQGFEFLPSVDTQVVVAFEAGNPRRPYIVGSCWNGKESLPEAPIASNNKRLIKTRSGSLLEFDDTEGAVKITVSTINGHQLVLDDGTQEISLTHSNGCEIVMTIAGQIRINANLTVEITASAVNVHAPMVSCDGTVRCTTLITQSVVSPLYTPGAGNVW
ncbi:phage baseplate assembly protein V [Methyloglobulus sp.]|uniref:phage baseplate assembly protein V n=1 Tax=Methyloglobulus sp. TaxID=2518622 RepID=UPI0032B79285